MCATCGCGWTEHEHVDEHGHEHEHEHEHGHVAEHEPGHEHENGHADEHAHTDEHGRLYTHTHGHPHSHPHGHAHEPHAAPEGRSRRVRFEEEVLAKNARAAARNRAWLDERRVVALNFMSAPGAGKTTLLERTIRRLGAELRITVLEGDQETDADAERIRATGCAVHQINTGTGCHLDGEMVAAGLAALDPQERSLLLIENVGNLVCPALFDLGERAKVVILSVTEGEDKPLKYPHIFRAANVLLLGKIDLLQHLEFDAERCVANALRVNPSLAIFRVSALRGDGMEAWYEWLRGVVRGEAEPARPGQAAGDRR